MKRILSAVFLAIIAVAASAQQIVRPKQGGTGVSNAGTITNAGNTTFTGGGTVAIGGFTFTVPATGTGVIQGGALGTPSSGGLANATGLSLTSGVTGVLGVANGGTGINNAGTFTNATASSITGGGTLALGGFTLTVPSTGTAVLTSTAVTCARLPALTSDLTTPSGSCTTTLATVNSNVGTYRRAKITANGKGLVTAVVDGDTVTALTDGATIATDCSLGNYYRVTLGGNRTLSNPTNMVDGQRGVWEIIQDGTGTRTLALGTNFKFGTDITSVTMTTTASKRDFLTAVYNSTTTFWYVVGFVKGY